MGYIKKYLICIAIAVVMSTILSSMFYIPVPDKLAYLSALILGPIYFVPMFLRNVIPTDSMTMVYLISIAFAALYCSMALIPALLLFKTNKKVHLLFQAIIIAMHFTVSYMFMELLAGATT